MKITTRAFVIEAEEMSSCLERGEKILSITVPLRSSISGIPTRGMSETYCIY